MSYRNGHSEAQGVVSRGQRWGPEGAKTQHRPPLQGLLQLGPACLPSWLWPPPAHHPAFAETGFKLVGKPALGGFWLTVWM